MAKLVKPNVLRGKIFDTLAGAFGESVLGMYENKLRVEWIDEDTGEVVQFSLAPVVHKTLVEDVECDPLVPVAEQVAAYEAEVAAKQAEKDAAKTKKEKAPSTKKAATKKAEVVAFVDATPVVPIEATEDELKKLSDLAALANAMKF